MRIKHGVTTLKKELDAIRHPPEVVDVVAIMHTARCKQRPLAGVG